MASLDIGKRDARTVLTEELNHTRQHLEQKGKSPEFYQELGEYCEALEVAINAIKNPIIRCKDCKYQVKQFVPDKRYKEGGYWESGCSNFGARCGYWAFGGADDEFCSDAEPKEGDCL